MKATVTPKDWLPVAVTGALFFLVVFGTDAVASTTWADLAGIAYLLASPAVFGAVRSAAPDAHRLPDWTPRPFAGRTP